MTEPIKAYTVCDNYGDSWLLVFASDRNRARKMAVDHGTWNYDGYEHTQSRRAKQFDGAFDCETVIDTNEEIPAGFPDFYNDDWDGAS